MTCKDCFHNVTCVYRNNLHHAESHCEDFINKENVVEVKHGRWVERSDKGIIGVLRCPYECNICGRVETFKEPYCNCGAKMKGEE